MIDKLITDDIRNAFIKILLDRWGSRVCNLKPIPVPQKIKDASAFYINESNPVLGFLLEKYDFTNNKTDTIRSNILLTAFNLHNGGRYCPRKFKNGILSIGRGVGYDTDRKGSFYFGLVLKDTDEEV